MKQLAKKFGIIGFFFVLCMLWATPVFAALPVNQSLSPNGQQYFGASTKYTLTSVHTDPDPQPARQVEFAYLLVNSTPSIATSTDEKLYAYYDAKHGHFYLCRGGVEVCLDAGAEGISDVTVANNWVTLFQESSASISADGMTVTVTWVFSVFENAWTENANAYLRTVDQTGGEDTWEDFADYYIDSEKPVQAIQSVNGSTGFTGSPKRITVTRPAADIVVQSSDLPVGTGAGVDRVEITALNGVSYPSPFRPRFISNGGGSYSYTNLSLEINHIRNRLTIATTDKAGNVTTEDIIIVYFPDSHIDVRTIAHQTGAKTLQQSDNLGELPTDVVNMDTIVSVAGTEGLMCTYFRNTNFTGPNLSVIESSINHWNDGARMADHAGHSGESAEYSVRCEGRVRSEFTGRHQFLIQLGKSDNVRLYVDDPNVPLIDYTYASGEWDSVIAAKDLERNKWYGFILEYRALTTASDTDFLTLFWDQPKCENYITTYGGCPNSTLPESHAYSLLDASHLAFSAGGLTEFTPDFKVTVTLPRGFQYNAGTADYFTVDAITGVPSEPTVTPPTITYSDTGQTLTWLVTDVIPVAKSIRFNYDVTMLYAYPLE